jgi:hypothetical protein
MSFKRDEVDLVNSYNGKTDVLLNGDSDFDQIVFVLRYLRLSSTRDALSLKCVLYFKLVIS